MEVSSAARREARWRWLGGGRGLGGVAENRSGGDFFSCAGGVSCVDVMSLRAIFSDGLRAI